MNTEAPTKQRATHGQVEHDARLLAKAGIGDHLIHAMPFVLMILNKERQAIYCNRRLIELLDVSSDHDILGLRPGEILDCIHAHNDCNGCGNTEFCRECGAAKAISESQGRQVETEAECRITTTAGRAIELRVWAMPYHCGNSEFTIFTLSDIHHEKRRQAIEQTLFHDMTNMLTTISCHSKLLEMSGNGQGFAQSIKAIRVASKELVDEIRSHHKLVQAETGEMEVEPTPGIDSLALVNEIIALGWKRPTILDAGSEAFELATDRPLLFRILFNMVKNANEATAETGTVAIECRRERNTGVFSVHNPGYMSRPVQLQLFQRSFSTKGKGHGIGTYSMRLFGEKYLKGKVGFTTSKQTGTTFYIALPLVFPEI